MNPTAPARDTACLHCGLPSGGARFCCAGCAGAYDIIQGSGLGAYYRQRVLDAQARPPRPAQDGARSFAPHAVITPSGQHRLDLAVEGLNCGACVWLIERMLLREPDVISARVNLTTRRLRIVWRGAPESAQERATALAMRVESLGYHVVAFDPAWVARAEDRALNLLLRCLSVAGFACANVMLLSIGTWAGIAQNMGPATRALMHLVSAMIALPAIAYAGQPFFRPACAALRRRAMTMDVPISAGVLIVSGVSLAQTLRGGLHVYFDSAVTLLFFLLLGRVLDHRARGQARQAAQHLLMLRARDVQVVAADGTVRIARPDEVTAGDLVLVPLGERVGVDGTVQTGSTTLDASVVTGESLPVQAVPGAFVFAGSVNLGGAITVRASAGGGQTLLAECVRLIEQAETARVRFVALTDRVARFYAPVVHGAALAAFLAWWLVLGRPLMDSLLVAAAVLLVTCPCALALAVPAVQVIATQRLLRRGVLLKSGTALERLAGVDVAVFDKTGTLTEPVLVAGPGTDPAAIRLAAGMAASSRHPLCRALMAGAAMHAPFGVAAGVVEHRGQGMSLPDAGGEIRLGSREFCGVTAPAEAGPELWLARPGHAPCRFRFEDRLRPDAAATVAALRRLRIDVILASGDAEAAVARAAAALGIGRALARQTPLDKMRLVEGLRAQGRRVLMLGDGVNDAPCLSAADVSVSPACAAEISQSMADAVIQGGALMPAIWLLRLARRARRLMVQNVALSAAYNIVLVPLAACGLVTPWLAALAMSASSLLVVGNAFRAGAGRGAWA